MNRPSYLESIALGIVTFLFALLLTGCSGSAPDLSTPPDPAAELAACRTVLEEFQSQDSYHLKGRAEFTDALNDYTEYESWKHGEDWLQVQMPQGGDVFGYLRRGGDYFTTERADFELGVSWPDDLKWGAMDFDRSWDHWLHQYKWEDLNPIHVSTAMTGEGRTITAAVTVPEENIDYLVEFSFDSKGDFQNFVIREPSGSENTPDLSVDVLTIVSTDETEIAARIDGELKRAMEQNNQGDPDTQEALAVCGAVLKELQSHDSYHLYEETELTGNRFTKNTIRQGEDWLFYNNVEADNFAAGYLSKNGERFNTEMANGRSTPGDLKWASVPGLPEYMETYAPWLYTCDWDSQDVKLLSDTVKGGTRTISVQIDTPYVYPSSPRAAAAGYKVEFRFDKNGDFMDAMMLGSFHHEDAMYSEYDYFLKEKVSIVTTDPEKVAAAIEYEYQRALEQTK